MAVDGVLLKLNGNCVTLEGLVDTKTGNFINDATVSVTIEASGVVLVDAQVMPNLPGTDGDYQTDIAGTVVLPSSVTMSVDAVDTFGFVFKAGPQVVPVIPRPFC